MDIAPCEKRLPKSQEDRLAAAEIIGQDGWKLLTDLFDPMAPGWVREIPAIDILRRIWIQNYRYEDGQVHWRDQSDIPDASLFINAPYDPQARYAKKYDTRWTGNIRACDRNMRCGAASPDRSRRTHPSPQK